MASWMQILVVWLLGQTTVLTTLETQWAEFVAAVGPAAKAKAALALLQTLLTALQTIPLPTTTPPAAEASNAHATLQARSINWAGLLQFLEGLEAILAPILTPKPAA